MSRHRPVHGGGVGCGVRVSVVVDVVEVDVVGAVVEVVDSVVVVVGAVVEVVDVVVEVEVEVEVVGGVVGADVSVENVANDVVVGLAQHLCLAIGLEHLVPAPTNTPPAPAQHSASRSSRQPPHLSPGPPGRQHAPGHMPSGIGTSSQKFSHVWVLVRHVGTVHGSPSCSRHTTSVGLVQVDVRGSHSDQKQ